MISLTRINHAQLVLNSDLIEQIQATPDTVITLTNGRNYMVIESPEEVVNRVLEFKRKLSDGFLQRCPYGPASSPSAHAKGDVGHGL